MAATSIIVFLLSLLSFSFVLTGILFYFTKKTSHQNTLKIVSEGSIGIFFIYILYREVLTFLDIKKYFMYETELFAYLGLLAWLYLLNKNVHNRAYKFIIFGLALLAVVFISFYAIVFAERIFNMCGIVKPCFL